MLIISLMVHLRHFSKNAIWLQAGDAEKPGRMPPECIAGGEARKNFVYMHKALYINGFQPIGSPAECTKMDQKNNIFIVNVIQYFISFKLCNIAGCSKLLCNMPKAKILYTGKSIKSIAKTT